MDRLSLSWSELRDICTSLGDGAFLGTVQSDGRPHVSWVGVGFGNDSLWTATYAQSQKAKNLRHSEEVALHWPENPDALVFLRASARLVDSAAERAQRWNEGVLPYDQEQFYGSMDNPELLFVELNPYRATVQGADPSAPPRIWRAGKQPPPREPHEAGLHDR